MHRNLWYLLLILAIFVGLQPPRAQAQGGGQAGCSELQVVFVVDQSGSMFGVPDQNIVASDPQQYRNFGTQTAIDILGSLRYQRHPSTTIKVAAVDFGDTIALRLPWTELTATTDDQHRKEQAQIAAVLGTRTSDLANTNFIAGLEGAASLFSQVTPPTNGCPNRAVVLITDGQPAGPSVSDVPSHFAKLERYINQYMGRPDHQIFVIGLDETNQYWDQVRGNWQQITGDASSVIRVTSAQEMGSRMLEIATRMTSALQVTGGDVTPTCLRGSNLPVPPFTRQLQLIMVKNNPLADTLRVFDAANQEVRPGRRDLQVTLEGDQEPIETLTITSPPPGTWRIETSLPPAALQNCQVQLLTFRAAGQLTAPQARNLVQYRRAPVDLRLVDATGADLPVYTDPQYGLQITPVTVAGGVTSTLTLSPAQQAYRYTGEVLPLSPGPLAIGARAVSRNPDGSQLVIFDRTLASYDVLTVTLGLTSPVTSTLGQYSDTALSFSLFAGTQPITIDLPLALQATVTGPDGATQTVPVSATDQLFSGAFRPQLPGTSTLRYAATVETPNGPQTIPGGTFDFDVFKATLVRMQVVEPVAGSYTATDLFLQPTGMPLEIAVTTESGQPLGLGDLGIADLSALLRVSINDSRGALVTDTLQLVQTGSPSRFRLAPNWLGPGDYTITFAPKAPLGRGYAWSERSFSTGLRGQYDPRALALIAAVLGLIGLIVWALNSWRQAARNPLTGYIEIYQEKPSLLDDTDTVRNTVLKRSLPRRNRVVITPSTGLLGVLERWLHLDLARNKSSPVRRLVISSPSAADAQNRIAQIEILLRDKNRRTTQIGPSTSPYSLGMTYFLVKGPRHEDSAGALIDMSDTFAQTGTRR